MMAWPSGAYQRALDPTLRQRYRPRLGSTAARVRCSAKNRVNSALYDGRVVREAFYDRRTDASDVSAVPQRRPSLRGDLPSTAPR